MSFFKRSSFQIRIFSLIYFTVGLVSSLITRSIISENQWNSFVVGQVCVGISLISIMFSVQLFFLKKNIALLVAVIVFKWPILMYIVYKMTEMINFKPEWVAIGFLPILASSLIWSFLQKQ